MPQRSEFVEFVIEQMAPIGRPRVRAMFGGYGVYRDDSIFAIIVDDRLYFKADAVTRAEFEAKGLRPFSYVARGKPVTMQYFEAPPEVFDEPEAMCAWARKAYEAAIRAKKPKPPDKAPQSRRTKRRAATH
ncbi:MAG TPA: TfoX/Sxy family protein [Acidiferrobacterales bacterium]|jgi:DNA transformation protein